MKSGLIYIILILLFLSYGESNANINNDTLFTSPNENTALVQQFIDSLESVDTDYIVHVKKIDNSTSQTLYSNYILWADVLVRKFNKYEINELDDISIDSKLFSITDTGATLNIDRRTDLFYLINAHQRTLFGENPLQTFEYKGNLDCRFDIVLIKRDEKIEFSVPCNLDFYSEYYEKLSKTLYYPLYILLKKSIVNYIDGYDFYLNKDIVTIEKLKKDLEEYIDYKERIIEFIEKIKLENQSFESREFGVYIPLLEHHKIKSQIVDSLCQIGVSDIIQYSIGSYWSDVKDTSHTLQSSTNFIIWREDSSEFLKIIVQGKFFVSPPYLISNNIFRFLDLNIGDFSNNELVERFNSSLDIEEDSLREIERRKEEERVRNTEYPLIKGDTIMVYADKMSEKFSIGSKMDGVSEDYNIYLDDDFINFRNYDEFDPSFNYIYKDNTNTPFYIFHLLIDNLIDEFYRVYDISVKHCKVRYLDVINRKDYWLNEIKEYENTIENVNDNIESLKKKINELESENNSK